MEEIAIEMFDAITHTDNIPINIYIALEP